MPEQEMPESCADVLLTQAAYRYRKIRELLLDARSKTDGVDALLGPESRAACAKVSSGLAAFQFTPQISSTVCMIVADGSDACAGMPKDRRHGGGLAGFGAEGAAAPGRAR